MRALIGLMLMNGCSNERTRQADPRMRARDVPIAPAPGPRFELAIDPKNSEAARLLVGAFVRLINERRFADAYMLLGSGASPRDQFVSGFRRFTNLEVSARDARNQEGAAGSIYLSVPLDVARRLGGHLTRAMPRLSCAE